MDAATLLGINVSLWILSLILGKCWPVDFVWSSWPGLMAGGILYRSPLKFVSPKQWLFFALIWFWGLRLTLNFVLRGGVGHEDWRYVEMREMVGKRWFPLASLPLVFLGQSLFNFLGCISIYGMMRNRFSTMNTLDLVGLALALLAIVIETAADEQLDEFARKKSKPAPVLDTGLWGWSRHPNYFGECLFWWSLWVCGGCELGPALVGPLAMTLLFLGISIPLMEDRQLLRKKQSFINYQRKVQSPLVPLPPIVMRSLCPRPREEEESAQPPPAPAQAAAATSAKAAAKGVPASTKVSKKETKKGK